MKTTKRTYTPPPDAIYNAGKRKATVTKAIKLTEQVISEGSLKNHPTLIEAIRIMKNHRHILDKI